MNFSVPLCTIVKIQVMRVELKRTDDAFRIEAVAENGNSVVFDGSKAIGGSDKGVSPMLSLFSKGSDKPSPISIVHDPH